MDRRKFFDAIRASMHGGRLTQDQVESYEAILDACAAFKISDPRQIAYVLATARGEVGSGMQPVREIGQGRGKPYGATDPASGHAYYGRGFVQITWARNYRVLGKRLGLDLYGNPDLALGRNTAARIIAVGMAEGLFTGKKLSDYINGTFTDYVGARRIINGQDRAVEFAAYAARYESALRVAMKQEGNGEVKEASGKITVKKPAPAPAPSPSPAPPPVQEKKPRVTPVQWIIGAIAAALAFIFAWVFTGGSQ